MLAYSVRNRTSGVPTYLPTSERVSRPVSRLSVRAADVVLDFSATASTRVTLLSSRRLRVPIHLKVKSPTVGTSPSKSAREEPEKRSASAPVRTPLAEDTRGVTYAAAAAVAIRTRVSVSTELIKNRFSANERVK